MSKQLASWPFVTATTTSTTPPQQLDLAGLKEAISATDARMEAEASALRKLFEDHGYDLANGDMMYHAPGMAFIVPPRYRAQVQPHKLAEPGQVLFTRNPKFSLF